MNGTLLTIIVIMAVAMWISLVVLPIRIARKRHHPQENAVVILAIAGLFIPILWIIALAWAVSGGSDPRAAIRPVKRPEGYAGAIKMDFDQRFNPSNREEDEIFGNS